MPQSTIDRSLVISAVTTFRFFQTFSAKDDLVVSLHSMQSVPSYFCLSPHPADGRTRDGFRFRTHKKKENSMALNHTPDLTKGPPRSPRVRLGGYVILPRMLDKCRATIAGKNGEYHYACPQDQRFLEFVGIDAEALKKQAASGKGDGELLAWIQKNAKHKPTEPEILAWSHFVEQRAPSDTESREYFDQLHNKTAPKREDIATWFDLLDVDDYVSFGGQA
jgi:hypothetical protein